VLARNNLLVFGANIKSVGLSAPSEVLNDGSMLDNMSLTDLMLDALNIMSNYRLLVDVDMSHDSQKDSEQLSFCFHVIPDAL
jgi:hypothetical protein